MYHHRPSAGGVRLVEILDGDETICLTLPDPVPLGSPSASETYASPKDWEQHKARIRRLYLDENKPLKEVMEVMSRDYGHRGTSKMYKSRLTQWQFDTKYKKHQKCRIQKVQPFHRQSTASRPSATDLVNDDHSSSAQSSGSSFARTTSVDSGNENEDRRISQSTGSRLAQSRTFSVLSGKSATPPLSHEEQILALVQLHVETSFSYGFWKLDDSGICRSVVATQEASDFPEAYFDLLRSAVLLLAQHSATEAQQVLSKAFGLVKPILKNGCVRALNFFWASLVYLVQFGHPGIVALLIGHIKDMAEVVFRPSHPILKIFTLLTGIPVAELEPFVHNTWQLTVDAFRQQLPRHHPESVRHQCDLIFRIYGTRDPHGGEQRLRQLLAVCEANTQTPEISHLIILNALGYNSMNYHQWAQAVSIGQRLAERARLTCDPELLVYQLGGLEIQARAFYEQKLVVQAVECLARATPLIAKQWCKEDPWRIELMALQQNWLREIGQIDAADVLKAEIISLAATLDVE